MRILIICAVSVLGVVLLVLTRPETQAELQPPPAQMVEVETVRRMDIQPVTRVTGKLQPARQTELRFEVSGRITERLVEPGQRVQQGDLLLRIADGDFADTVAEFRAQVQEEESAIARDRRLLELVIRERELQQREVARLERLGKESLTSQSLYDEAMQRLLRQQAEEASLRHAVDTQEARLATRRAALNRAQRNLERTYLNAPFAAAVNAVAVEVGDYVSPGQPALELVYLGELDLYLEITGAVAARLELGQSIRVRSGDSQHHGRIVALAANPDPQTHTHALRVRLAGDGLYAGQLAEAELPGLNLADVSVVPVAAVLREDGGAFVFRIRDNRLRKTPIDLVDRYRDLLVVEGVEAGDRVVSRDVNVLEEGQEVTVKY